ESEPRGGGQDEVAALAVVLAGERGVLVVLRGLWSMRGRVRGGAVAGVRLLAQDPPGGGGRVVLEGVRVRSGGEPRSKQGVELDLSERIEAVHGLLGAQAGLGVAQGLRGGVDDVIVAPHRLKA